MVLGDDVRVVLIEARPGPASADFALVGGAFVVVYTTEPTDSKALHAAIAAVTGSGWVVLSVERPFKLSAFRAQATPETQRLYEQAFACGMAMAFNKFPSEQSSTLH